jgi:hypothetical protein
MSFTNYISATKYDSYTGTTDLQRVARIGKENGSNGQDRNQLNMRKSSGIDMRTSPEKRRPKNQRAKPRSEM